MFVSPYLLFYDTFVVVVVVVAVVVVVVVVAAFPTLRLVGEMGVGCGGGGGGGHRKHSFAHWQIDVFN